MAHRVSTFISLKMERMVEPLMDLWIVISQVCFCWASFNVRLKGVAFVFCVLCFG